MKVLDLFAGIGGFSKAAEWCGWETIAFVEKDEFCQQVLPQNFPKDIPIYGDIKQFTGHSFRGVVDLVTGGFPCQPFSQAGNQKGTADERHLFPEMLRVISEVKPRWVVAENVRGILGIENGNVFAEVISSLEGQGYEVTTFCIPLSALDAPHRRDRIWFIARLSDVAFDAEHARLHGPEIGKSVGKGKVCEAGTNEAQQSSRSNLSRGITENTASERKERPPRSKQPKRTKSSIDDSAATDTTSNGRDQKPENGAGSPKRVRAARQLRSGNGDSTTTDTVKAGTAKNLTER